MKHNREEYNKHIQALIKMMQDDTYYCTCPNCERTAFESRTR